MDRAIDKKTLGTEYQKIKSMIPFTGDVETYHFLRDAYTGGGGYQSGEYLVPHPREAMEKYIRRQFMAYYLNYVAPSINTHVNPIFKEYPVRECKQKNMLYEKFLSDSDGKKTPLDRLMKKAAIQAKLYGAAFIVVDNFVEQPKYYSDVLNNRQFPYVYLIRPEQVESWAADRFDNLTMIRYKYKRTVYENNAVVHKTVTVTWTKKMWQVTSAGQTREGDNAIGEIPVIPLVGAAIKDENELVPLSDFYQIARANLALYNACSELRERNRGQAFSLLTYPVDPEDDFSAAGEVAAGVSDMLLYKAASSSQPEFKTPSAEPSEVLINEIKMIIEEIYRMAERANTTGVQSHDSGIAKEWDNQGLFQTIAEFAKNIEEAEEKLADIFGKYTGHELKCKVNYNDDFGVVDVSAELDKITKALGLDISPTYNAEIKKQAVKKTLQELDDDVLNTIFAEIDRVAAGDAIAGSEDD